MINIFYKTDFQLDKKENLLHWLAHVIQDLGFQTGEVNYIFTDDEELHRINVEFLHHDTYTDIISFDYTEENIINGDIFISIDRVKENAGLYSNTFEDELHRVMVHGILHYAGLKDKTPAEQKLMRSKEDYYLSLRDF